MVTCPKNKIFRWYNITDQDGKVEKQKTCGECNQLCSEACTLRCCDECQDVRAFLCGDCYNAKVADKEIVWGVFVSRDVKKAVVPFVLYPKNAPPELKLGEHLAEKCTRLNGKNGLKDSRDRRWRLLSGGKDHTDQLDKAVKIEVTQDGIGEVHINAEAIRGDTTKSIRWNGRRFEVRWTGILGTGEPPFQPSLGVSFLLFVTSDAPAIGEPSPTSRNLAGRSMLTSKFGSMGA
mmetsp:Transcript_93923/g.214761  ORF Transcript_93923/g.214761 Transcript_93923/m.214761 type:complete len:234 (+) Transcript_93923:396-1097(+)